MTRVYTRPIGESSAARSADMAEVYTPPRLTSLARDRPLDSLRSGQAFERLGDGRSETVVDAIGGAARMDDARRTDDELDGGTAGAPLQVEDAGAFHDRFAVLERDIDTITAGGHRERETAVVGCLYAAPLARRGIDDLHRPPENGARRYGDADDAGDGRAWRGPGTKVHRRRDATAADAEQEHRDTQGKPQPGHPLRAIVASGGRFPRHAGRFCKRNARRGTTVRYSRCR